MSTTGVRSARSTARTLPIGAEVRRQWRRRRTKLAFGFLLVLPLLLVAAFALGDGEGEGSGFVDLAQVGALNFAVFTLFASAGFLLVVLVALFFGDAVPAEASWASLRYLLVAPVPRGRLLRAKLQVAAGSALLALLLLPGWCLVVGTVAYGVADYRGPTGVELGWSEMAPRLLLVVAYLFVNLLWVGALAFLVGVLTDAPLGAVGAAVLVVILSSILDTIEPLGDFRQALPTHEQFAWAGALQSEIAWSGMLDGALWSIGYATVFLAAAFWWFGRKDVLS